MGCIVYDRPGGTPLNLSGTPIGKGGEGEVYVGHLNGGKEIAVKLFSGPKLTKDREFLSEKIAAMVKIGQADGKALIRHKGVAWPQMAVYGSDGKFTGYAMRRAKGKTLNHLAHAMAYKDHFKDLDRVKLARMLIKLLGGANDLHCRYIRIGDVNLNNVLCDENYNPCWIDVDSYQIGVGDESDGPAAPERMNLRLTAEENREENAQMKPDKIWRCPVGRPEMTPPEHLDQAYSEITRTYAGDVFSLAILVFQCLMLGKHPYEHIKGGALVDNLRKGHVPYLTGGARPDTTGAVPRGPWYNMWDWYTHEIKLLVQRTLKDGAKTPSARANLIEWIRCLKAYVRVLTHPESEHRREMMPQVPKPRGRDPRDTRNARHHNKEKS